jgi:hypothetical protein
MDDCRKDQSLTQELTPSQFAVAVGGLAAQFTTHPQTALDGHPIELGGGVGFPGQIPRHTQTFPGVALASTDAAIANTDADAIPTAKKARRKLRRLFMDSPFFSGV